MIEEAKALPALLKPNVTQIRLHRLRSLVRALPSFPLGIMAFSRLG